MCNCDVQDLPEIEQLLAPENVNHEALVAYAREAAEHCTNRRLPKLDLALNERGRPDIALFDFTSFFSAEYASRVLCRHPRHACPCNPSAARNHSHSPSHPDASVTSAALASKSGAPDANANSNSNSTRLQPPRNLFLSPSRSVTSPERSSASGGSTRLSPAPCACLGRSWKQHRPLLMCLVGDALHEPFWPRGTGYGRGCLSALDAAWLLRQWSLQVLSHSLLDAGGGHATNGAGGSAAPNPSGQQSSMMLEADLRARALTCLAERENVYLCLSQANHDNLCKEFDLYTINPKTRCGTVSSVRQRTYERTRTLCTYSTVAIEPASAYE